MKKRWSVFLAVVLGVSLLGACGTNTVNNNGNTATVTPVMEATQTPTETAEATAAVEPSETVEPTAEPVEETQKLEISIAALKGPTAIGMVELMEKSDAGETKNNYTFSILGAADEVSTGLVKGDYTFAAIPSNLASVLYNKTEGALEVVAVNTLGVLYILETGDSIQSVEDLKGKTIYSMGKGTTPEFTLNYLLQSAGIDPEKDVTIEYKSEATEVAALLSSGEDVIAMLPQPYVTTVMMQNEAVRIALDVTKEWETYTGDASTIVTGVVVAQKSFMEENKEAADAFLSEYAASASYVTANIEEASALVENYGIFSAAVAKSAIPYCNIVFIQGAEMKEKITSYLQVLYDQLPASVGGAMPGDDFYYIP